MFRVYLWIISICDCIVYSSNLIINGEVAGSNLGPNHFISKVVRVVPMTTKSYERDYIVIRVGGIL